MLDLTSRPRSLSWVACMTLTNEARMFQSVACGKPEACDEEHRAGNDADSAPACKVDFIRHRPGGSTRIGA